MNLNHLGDEVYHISEKSAYLDIMNLSHSKTIHSYLSLNTTVPPCEYELLGTTLNTNLTAVVILVFSSFALLSNFSFLLTVKKTNCLGKSLGIHLVTLSCVDISISICYILIVLRWLFYLANGILTFSFIAPYLLRFPLQVLASILVVSITVDRYRAISYPIRSMASGVSYRLRLMIVLTFVLAMIVIVVPLIHMIFLFDLGHSFECKIGNKVYVIRKAQEQYQHFVLNMLKYIAHILVGVDVVSMVTSVCLLALIQRKLSQAPDLGVGVRTRYQSEQRNLTRMILVNTAVFLICILFQDVVSLLLISYDFNLIFSGMDNLIVSSSTLFNSSVNPVIYNIFSSRYRVAFLKTFPFLTCSWWKRNSETSKRKNEACSEVAEQTTVTIF